MRRNQEARHGQWAGEIHTVISGTEKSLADCFGSDLQELVSGLGGEIASAQEITRLTSPRQRKAAFKLTFSDGRLFKARLSTSEEKRRRVTSVSALLGGLPLARIVAAQGRTTIEEWIAGVPLHEAEVTQEQVHQAGSLLGLIHTRTTVPAELRVDIPDVAWHMEKITSHLDTIATGYAGVKSGLCENILEIARQNQPATFESGLIHADFCASNMVLTGGGDIVLIDNEDLRVGALDYDLARCWCRWPMTEYQRQAFCEGYQQHRSLDSFMESSQFWVARALVLSMNVHLKHGRAAPALAEALHRLAEGEGVQIWPCLPVGQ